MADPLVLSIFPGIDLFGMAFELEGFCIVRGPDLIFGGDIHRFHPPTGVFEGVIGGPPCQAFSPLRHLVEARGAKIRHGNLIPEFERIVTEVAPHWFLMENVPPAPEPVVTGYGIRSFLLCPTIIDSDGDGFGGQQRRKRRFSFGLAHRSAIDLGVWINYAALELPDLSPTVSRRSINNSQKAKGRVKTHTVTCDPRPVPVKIGGSGKVKTSTVLGGHGPVGKGEGYCRRWTLEEMCELQGMPKTFLKDAPFTVDGKRMVLGNAVPLSMGRAVAKAVKRAMYPELMQPGQGGR